MNEKKPDLFEVSVEIRGISAAASLLSWLVGPDGCDRASMVQVHETLDGISRHLLRIAEELDN